MKRPLSPSEAVEIALAAIAEREEQIRAWVFLDADGARSEALRAPDGPLAGITVGVKDLIDTADQPTAYGSPIYAAHRPPADAAVVTQIRAAGGVVVGKTVTTEFAWVTPGPTTNPHRVTHTPGGSSSGSAAAVASGMVDLALGSQTAGSVIRPASFCGVLGMKPTFGLLPTAGVKPAAPSLDTIGLFARDLDLLQTSLSVLTGLDPNGDGHEPEFVLVCTDAWDAATADCREVVVQAASAVSAVSRELPDVFLGLAADTAVVQAREGARSLAWERSTYPNLLSDELRAIIDAGNAIGVAEYASVQRRAAQARTPEALDALFGSADIIVTPAAVGEAPEGYGFTGDPAFNRLWTLLGCPALTVPGAVGVTGLPIGIQLVARPYQDIDLICAARILQAQLRQG